MNKPTYGGHDPNNLQHSREQRHDEKNPQKHEQHQEPVKR
jgi:hypothetical protein